MASGSRKVQNSSREVPQSTEAATIEQAAPAAGAPEQSRPSNDGAPRPQLTPEARAKLAEIRARLEERVGQLVLMLMNVPRYRHQTLADLNHLILEPLLRDRIAIAQAKAEPDTGTASPRPAGIAIWASVDETRMRRSRSR